MKQAIFALVPNLSLADKMMNKLHQDLSIDTEDMSYVYRNEDGDRVEGDGTEASGKTVGEGAKDGAKTGGLIGAAIGIVAATGVLVPLGAIVAAGPIATALGLTGAVGATLTTTAVGAAAGGLVGALMHLGLSEPDARTYEEAVAAGEVLISVMTDEADQAIAIMEDHSATRIIVIEDTI